jgi:hypothetical protein
MLNLSDNHQEVPMSVKVFSKSLCLFDDRPGGINDAQPLLSRLYQIFQRNLMGSEDHCPSRNIFYSFFYLYPQASRNSTAWGLWINGPNVWGSLGCFLAASVARLTPKQKSADLEIISFTLFYSCLHDGDHLFHDLLHRPMGGVYP